MKSTLIIAAISTCFAVPFASAQNAPGDLAAAFTTCRQHWQSKPIITMNGPPIITQGWEPGWEECQVVQDTYQKSETAKHDRERAAQVEADRQRVIDLSKKLSK